MAPKLKRLAILAASAISAATAYDVISESYVFTRNLRAIRCGINILYQYKIRFNETNVLEVHEAVAKDIYESTLFFTKPAWRMTVSM